MADPQLFTKAYEFFKAHKTKNMTFFVASQIALAHYEGGNHEMALKQVLSSRPPS